LIIFTVKSVGQSPFIVATFRQLKSLLLGAPEGNSGGSHVDAGIFRIETAALPFLVIDQQGHLQGHTGLRIDDAKVRRIGRATVAENLP
jgi:hypothetical protein